MRSVLVLNRNKHIGNDLFVFYKFPLPSTFVVTPCPTGVPGKCLPLKKETSKALSLLRT